MSGVEFEVSAGQGAPWLPAHIADETRLVSLPFGRVFVCDVHPDGGSAQALPIVLLHGLFLTHHAFSRIIPPLAARRRVIALDLPGCGDSDRPNPRYAGQYGFDWMGEAVLQTLDALGISRCVLVGHDHGGALALSVAATQADRVSRLAVMAPLALTVSLPLQGTLSVAPSLGIDVFRRTLRRGDLKRFLEQGLSTPELLDESDLHVFWDRLCRVGGREATYAMLGQMPSVVRLRDQFAAVHTPTTLIWGDRDSLTPPEQSSRLAALLPNATEVLIDGCGHNPAYERPGQVVQLLERL